MPPKIRRAIALLSGGLDSALAAKMVKDQGVEVIGLHLLSPFGCENDVQKTASAIGIPLLFREKGEAYINLVENPSYGRGRAMNPCIDCRIYMFEIAEKVMIEEKAEFVVTGEVIGQRPMSQQAGAMKLIDRKSPIEGRVVRPLSAHCMETSVPELEGWVDRSQFLGISGRSRKEQLALAAQWGITAFAAPGGGCLLTEMEFGNRLKDFYQYKTHYSSEQRLAQSQLLRLGRHFRLSENTKVIVGRNQSENEQLMKWGPQSGGILFEPQNFKGPSAIALGTPDDSERETIFAILSRYGKGDEIHRTVTVKNLNTSFPIRSHVDEKQLEAWRL